MTYRFTTPPPWDMSRRRGEEEARRGQERQDDPAGDEPRRGARGGRVAIDGVSLVLNGKAEGRVFPGDARAHRGDGRPPRLPAPNVSAQMLRTGVGRTLAFAVPDIQQPFFGEVLVAAEVAARERGYSVLLVDTTTDPRWSERLVGMIRSRMIAGCITYTPDVGGGGALPPDVGDRVVMVESETPGLSGVDLTVDAAMRSVVGHLADLGHRRIGHFAARYPKLTFRNRRARLPGRTRTTGPCRRSPAAMPPRPSRSRAATEAAKSLIETGVTAIACDDDLLAGAAYRAARRLGLAIPDDLSVVGLQRYRVRPCAPPGADHGSHPGRDAGARGDAAPSGQARRQAGPLRCRRSWNCASSCASRRRFPGARAALTSAPPWP